MVLELDNWHWPNRPRSEADFDEMMASLNQHLAALGLKPHQRSLQAARLVSMRLGLSGHSVVPSDEQRGDPFSPSDLLWRVHEWFKTEFADRANIDFSPGSVVCILESTLWRIRLPRVWGEVRWFLDPNLEKAGVSLNRVGPATHNILTSVEGLTASRAARLTQEELVVVANAFLLGFMGLGYLDRLKGHVLFDEARADYRSSVDTLMLGQTPGKARYETAQCAEKVFKGLLASAGHDYPTWGREGHDVLHLGSLVTDKMGLQLRTEELPAIQSPSSDRYGEPAITLENALAAHKALLKVLQGLDQVS